MSRIPLRAHGVVYLWLWSVARALDQSILRPRPHTRKHNGHALGPRAPGQTLRQDGKKKIGSLIMYMIQSIICTGLRGIVVPSRHPVISVLVSILATRPTLYVVIPEPCRSWTDVLHTRRDSPCIDRILLSPTSLAQSGLVWQAFPLYWRTLKRDLHVWLWRL